MKISFTHVIITGKRENQKERDREEERGKEKESSAKVRKTTGIEMIAVLG